MTTFQVAPVPSWPTDPISAVVHPDPAEYHRWLARRGVHQDVESGWWVVADATDVREVLAHPLARVRPPDAPVPPRLVGTPAGDVFARLARTTDGADHHESRGLLTRHLDALESATVEDACETIAALLGPEHAAATIVAQWSRRFPLGVVARLVDVDHARLDELTEDVALTGAAFGPAAAPVEPT